MNPLLDRIRNYAGKLATAPSDSPEDAPVLRGVFVAVLTGILVMGHFLTPVGDDLLLHSSHVFLRNMFLIPVILAAIWFGVRGACVTAAVISLFYVPHVILQWGARPSENISQAAQLATLWGVGIVGGLLVNREKKAIQAIANCHEGTLVALVTALDARERDTQLHSLRVRAYAVLLGQQLGLNPHQLAILGEAALLHDVGKIGVPDAILLKPDGLTSKEREVVEKHPITGERILRDVPFLQEAARIVYAHHERYDGGGYPEGLAGNEIPLGARIFAVVDTFDALRSARPYKPALSYEEAVRTIREGSGTQFDPYVVEAFMAVPKRKWDELAEKVRREHAGALKEVV
ncbi:MAG: HD-GYP domain-containing protein [Candidatus Hydrogenedentota bacterium]